MAGFMAVMHYEVMQKVLWGCHKALASPAAHDRKFQRELWQASSRVCGLPDDGL